MEAGVARSSAKSENSKTLRAEVKYQQRFMEWECDAWPTQHGWLIVTTGEVQLALACGSQSKLAVAHVSKGNTHCCLVRYIR